MKKIIILMVILFITPQIMSIDATDQNYAVDSTSTDFLVLLKHEHADSAEYVTPDDGTLITTRGTVTSVKPGGFAWGRIESIPNNVIIQVTGLQYSTGLNYVGYTIKPKVMDSLYSLYQADIIQLTIDTVYYGEEIVSLKRRWIVPKAKIQDRINVGRYSPIQ